MPARYLRRLSAASAARRVSWLNTRKPSIISSCLIEQKLAIRISLTAGYNYMYYTYVVVAARVVICQLLEIIHFHRSVVVGIYLGSEQVKKELLYYVHTIDTFPLYS